MKVTMYMVLNQGNGRSWTFVVDNDKSAIEMIKKAAFDNWTDGYDTTEEDIEAITNLRKLIKTLENMEYSIFKEVGEINSVKITID
jgi:hypothetical protein